jgi:2-dehydropantoate 2-reductase
MKVAVVGCGAIGGVVATVLALKGHGPHCFEYGEEIAGALNNKGLHVHGKLKGIRSVSRRSGPPVPVRAYPRLTKEQGTFDVIFIAVKNDALKEVFEQASGLLCRDGFIVTLQNGIEILSIAAEHPTVKIVAGAVSYNADMERYGEYIIRSKGGITIGSLNGATRDDLFIVQSLLAPRMPIHITDNTEGILWSKLLIVCGVTGLGGVAGLPVGKLLRRAAARDLFYRIVTEGSLTARKLGIRLEELGGAINPEKFGNHDAGLPRALRGLMLGIAGVKYRKLKSNIQRSLERGKTTEVGYLNGALVARGEAAGIDTPVNRKVLEYIGEMEAGKRSMDGKNPKRIRRDLARDFAKVQRQ